MMSATMFKLKYFIEEKIYSYKELSYDFLLIIIIIIKSKSIKICLCLFQR